MSPGTKSMVCNIEDIIAEIKLRSKKHELRIKANKIYRPLTLAS